jgi:hypothetical protein
MFMYGIFGMSDEDIFEAMCYYNDQLMYEEEMGAEAEVTYDNENAHSAEEIDEEDLPF